MNADTMHWAVCKADGWFNLVADKFNGNQGIVAILSVLVAIGLALLVFRWPFRAWGVVVLIFSLGIGLWIVFRPHPCCAIVDGFRMEIPNSLAIERQTDQEVKLADEKQQNWATFWVTGTSDPFEQRFDELTQDAKADRNAYIRPPSRKPQGYFVVSWQTADGMDHYEAEIISQTRQRGRQLHLRVNAHADGNPLTERDYEQMLDSLLVSAGIVAPVRHVAEEPCGYR